MIDRFQSPVFRNIPFSYPPFSSPRARQQEQETPFLGSEEVFHRVPSLLLIETLLDAVFLLGVSDSNQIGRGRVVPQSTGGGGGVGI